MKAHRIIGGALVVLFLGAGAICNREAGAASFSTDQSDLWWNPAESGWGIQLVQRNSVIFATMFVYDGSHIPHWYTATLHWQSDFTWSGDLIGTTGPWFGTVPFDSSTVTAVKVGTMTWASQAVTTGILTYTTGAISVSKNLTRQFIALDDFGGHYAGGFHKDTTGCVDNSLNGTSESMGMFNIVQSGSNITMQSLPSSGASCSFAGTLAQAGQMGSATGLYVCSTGETGGFQLFEMQVTVTGLTGRLNTTSNSNTGCKATGWFGGVWMKTL